MTCPECGSDQAEPSLVLVACPTEGCPNYSEALARDLNPWSFLPKVEDYPEAWRVSL